MASPIRCVALSRLRLFLRILQGALDQHIDHLDNFFDFFLCKEEHLAVLFELPVALHLVHFSNDLAMTAWLEHVMRLSLWPEGAL